MYTGSLQQLQMIQHAQLSQTESEQAIEQETPPLSRPLILSMAQGWERLWSEFAHRRMPSRTSSHRPHAV